MREILRVNPTAKFHLYCDDLRVRFIPDIFVAAGVDFADLQVTLLSDGTGTYSLYNGITEADYVTHATQWQQILQDYTDHRGEKNYTKYSSDQAMELQSLAFYISMFDNVEYWIQNPEYLVNEQADSLQRERNQMHIIKKQPEAMYQGLDAATKTAYQKVVLANALVDSETLTTLEEAVAYFDNQLAKRDKEVVLILGSSSNTLAGNQSYVDQTIAFYTPTVQATDTTKALYKGKTYPITNGEIEVDGKKLTVGECAVYLFFKGHPAHPANEELSQYFSDQNIVVLPHRTPVEVLFWMYDVKVGGFQSTSFLSTTMGQTEFFYNNPTTPALVLMKNAGFFANAVVFTK